MTHGGQAFSSLKVDFVPRLEPNTTQLEMRFASRCAVCWPYLTLLTRPDLCLWRPRPRPHREMRSVLGLFAK